MKPISIDLRERIVEAVENKEGTNEEIAERFKVCRALLQKLLKQKKETGRIEPLPHGGGPQPKLDAEAEALIGNRVLEKPDATLAELCAYLKKKRKIEISESTMCRLLQKLELTRKKKASKPQKQMKSYGKNSFSRQQIEILISLFSLMNLDVIKR